MGRYPKMRGEILGLHLANDQVVGPFFPFGNRKRDMERPGKMSQPVRIEDEREIRQLGDGKSQKTHTGTGCADDENGARRVLGFGVAGNVRRDRFEANRPVSLRRPGLPVDSAEWRSRKVFDSNRRGNGHRRQHRPRIPLGLDRQSRPPVDVELPRARAALRYGRRFLPNPSVSPSGFDRHR